MLEVELIVYSYIGKDAANDKTFHFDIKSIKKAALLALMVVGLTACTTQEQPTVHDYGVVTSGDFRVHMG